MRADNKPKAVDFVNALRAADCDPMNVSELLKSEVTFRANWAPRGATVTPDEFQIRISPFVRVWGEISESGHPRDERVEFLNREDEWEGLYLGRPYLWKKEDNINLAWFVSVLVPPF